LKTARSNKLIMGILLKTHKMLWGRSGNRCAFPTCRRLLVEDETESDDPSIVGDEAHIVAREDDGPRGNSPLSVEDRDKFDNLILMCKVHHKMIDDQYKTYTVEALHKMKRDHLDWVTINLNPDIDKQNDDEIYATYIDRWIELADINEWENWTSFVFGGGQPSMRVEKYNNLKKFNVYLLSRVWPKRYDKIDFAFNNFRVVLNDFINIFSLYKLKVGPDDDAWFETEKFYKRLREWNPQRYDELIDEYEFHVDLVQDLACELTRSANYLCDQIRKYITRSFRVNEGVLLIQTGPHMDLSYSTIRIEFKNDDQNFIKYPGLKIFMETRQDRGYCFGQGVSNKYLS
jgi:hypothetical protein